MANINVTVGQEVAIQSAYSNDNFMFGYVVAKVTPRGQVVAKRTSDGYTMRFDRDGYRMDSMSSKYRRERLVVDVAAANEVVRQAKARSLAAAAICAVRSDARHTNDKESLRRQVEELAAALEAARIAVEAI